MVIKLCEMSVTCWLQREQLQFIHINIIRRCFISCGYFTIKARLLMWSSSRKKCRTIEESVLCALLSSPVKLNTEAEMFVQWRTLSRCIMGTVGSSVCGLNIRTSPRLLLLSGGVTLNQFVGSCLMNFTTFISLFFNLHSCNDTLLIAATQNLQAELVSNVSVHQTSKQNL